MRALEKIKCDFFITNTGRSNWFSTSSFSFSVWQSLSPHGLSFMKSRARSRYWINDSKKGTAFIIYQKGLRDFQPKVAHAFAKGLISNDWRAEITTVSFNAPTDVSSYDLIVITWPTYWFNPSLPIKKYLQRTQNLEGKSTVIICTAAGAPLNSCEKMKSLVQAAGGTVIKSLILYTMRPNDGNGDPLETASRIGMEIKPS